MEYWQRILRTKAIGLCANVLSQLSQLCINHWDFALRKGPYEFTWSPILLSITSISLKTSRSKMN